MASLSLQQRFRGCLTGLACGDAVGTTLEFMPRGSFEPVTGMTGGGPFHLSPGEWTDDTAMALCLATSLLEQNGFDADDQMQRYVRWWKEGYMSSTGVCFDIGNATRSALQRYQDDGNPFAGSVHPFSAGNGSLMRLAPVVMFYFPDESQAIRYAADSSRTTHAAAECVDACRYFAALLTALFNGNTKQQLEKVTYQAQTKRVQAVQQGSYLSKSYDEIRGSGYVAESLEAALWCFVHHDSFEDAILAAVNLGDDADTTGAICGQLAGAFYGIDAIPAEWQQPLVKLSDITALADALSSHSAMALQH